MTVLALLSPAAAIVRTDEGQHIGHAGGSANGPLPEAVRKATERFRDVNVAIAEG